MKLSNPVSTPMHVLDAALERALDFGSDAPLSMKAVRVETKRALVAKREAKEAEASAAGRAVQAIRDARKAGAR